MSFGDRRQVHDARSDYGFTDLPVVIEIADSPDRIETLLSELRDVLDSSLVTVETARMLPTRAGRTMSIEGQRSG